MSTKIKSCIVLPGNGLDEDEDMSTVMWYGTFAEALQKELGIPCKLQTPPDPLYARRPIWTKHALDMGLDEHTLLVGHSSGAACALRLMEEYKMAGCLLVSAYDSDLGDKLERESGYFNGPFNYEHMKRNAGFIIQFHAQNDQLVPVECGRRVAAGLGLGGDDKKFCYHEKKRDGHFQMDSYPEFIEALKEAIFSNKE